MSVAIKVFYVDIMFKTFISEELTRSLVTITYGGLLY